MSCVADLSTSKSGAFQFLAKEGEITRPPAAKRVPASGV
jgi:hypothetical protein